MNIERPVVSYNTWEITMILDNRKLIDKWSLSYMKSYNPNVPNSNLLNAMPIPVPTETPRFDLPVEAAPFDPYITA